MREDRPPGMRPGTAACMECDWTSEGRPTEAEALASAHTRDHNHGTVCRPLLGTGRFFKKKVENIVDSL